MMLQDLSIVSSADENAESFRKSQPVCFSLKLLRILQTFQNNYPQINTCNIIKTRSIRDTILNMHSAYNKFFANHD